MVARYEKVGVQADRVSLDSARNCSQASRKGDAIDRVATVSGGS